MLRQKRILNSSLYYYKKSFNVRSFHLSCSSHHPRGPPSSKRNSEIKPALEEPNVAGSFVAQPLKSTFNNFYGIESDEGVIHITSSTTLKSPENSFLNKFTSKNLPERFKRTSFGKVRLDKENKVILHGQFDETLSTPYEVEISRDRRLRNFAIKKTDSIASSVEETQDPMPSNFNDMVNETETQAKISEVNVNKVPNQKEEKYVSFIDELYFPDKLHSNDSSLKDTQLSASNIQEPMSSNLHDLRNETETHAKLSDINVDKIQLQKEAKDVSFIDELYFPEKLPKNQDIDPLLNAKSTNLIEDCFFGKEVVPNEKSVNNINIDGVIKLDSETILSHEIPEHKLSSTDETVSNLTQSIKSEGNVSFIPEMKCNAEVKEINQQSENVSPLNEEGNMSFIDECFFKNKTQSGTLENNPEHLMETASAYINHGDLKEVRKIQSDKKVRSTEFIKDKIHNWGDTEFLNTAEHKTKHHNSSDPKENVNDNSNRDHSSLKNTTNFVYKDTLRKSLRSIKTRERTPSKDYPSIKKLNDESTPKQEKLIEKDIEKDQFNDKSTEQDQPETAYDFVKKLRGEGDKEATYHETLSGFKTLPPEKLDSKGFRILKSQVPELKYYTRDEMLELLVKNVLYSDDDVVVLNKPYNLVMHESKTTKDACLSKYLDDFAGLLDKQAKHPKLLTVHRLDKETTGCLLLARNEVSAQRLKSLFAQRKITKTYWIVTIRVPDPLQGIIDIPISEGFIEKKARMVLHPDLPKDIAYRNHSKRGKNAVTHYNVISQSGNAALVEVKPETGIKHQIRVHFGLGLGCPILGDNKYSYPDKFVPQKLSSDLLHRLHVQQSKVRHIPMHIYARSVFIPQYTTGRNLFVVAPMPAHMSKNLQKLKFRKN